MSKYTTGELAKLCGVTVRTVQYYDTRGILIPSELSEGGRRLYSDNDLKQMRIICFLRELGLPINAILQVLSEDNPKSVLSLLIERQESELKNEIAEYQKQLDKLAELKRGLDDTVRFSVESISDIAYVMNHKSKLKKMRVTMVLTGIPVTAFQWTSIVLWITQGLWWLFVIWALAAIIWGTVISKYYYDRVAYICPECHKIFKPEFKEMFWANHTPTLRKLTCTCCGHKGWFVETCAEAENDK